MSLYAWAFFGRNEEDALHGSSELRIVHKCYTYELMVQLIF